MLDANLLIIDTYYLNNADFILTSISSSLTITYVLLSYSIIVFYNEFEPPSELLHVLMSGVYYNSSSITSFLTIKSVELAICDDDISFFNICDGINTYRYSSIKSIFISLPYGAEAKPIYVSDDDPLSLPTSVIINIFLSAESSRI